MNRVETLRSSILLAQKTIKKGQQVKKQIDAQMIQAIVHGDTFAQAKLAGMIEDINVDAGNLQKCIASLRQTIQELKGL